MDRFFLWDINYELYYLLVDVKYQYFCFSHYLNLDTYFYYLIDKEYYYHYHSFNKDSIELDLYMDHYYL
jgi:hypothetical protein